MYPEVTPAIRSAIELRYRLLPYLYTLLWQAHADDEPMLRPTFLDHEHDPQTFAECDDLLGRDLLVASVVEPGASAPRLAAGQSGRLVRL
jgi:alpha-glucosidase